jgi:hypothetical protein
MADLGAVFDNEDRCPAYRHGPARLTRPDPITRAFRSCSGCDPKGRGPDGVIGASNRYRNGSLVCRSARVLMNGRG